MKRYGYLVYTWLKDVDLDAKLPTRPQVFKMLKEKLSDEFGGTSRLFKPIQYCDGTHVHMNRTHKGILCCCDFLIPSYFYDGLKQEYKDKLQDFDESLPKIPRHDECPLCGRKDEK